MPIGPLHYLPCNSHARPPHDLSPPHLMAHVDFGRARNLNDTHPKWVVFSWAPKWRGTQWMESSGLPPNITKHPKAMRSKPLTTSPLSTKKVIVHPAMRQTVIVHLYPPSWLFANKSKKLQIIVFIVFLAMNSHAHTCESWKSSTHINLHSEDAKSSQIAFQPNWSLFNCLEFPFTWFKPSFYKFQVFKLEIHWNLVNF